MRRSAPDGTLRDVRRSALVPLLLVVAAALAGCATTSGSCIDYIALSTPQARFDTASVVEVATTIRRTDRTVEQNGIYTLHRAHIERVLKGRVRGTDIDVLAPSDQCTVSGRPVTYLDRDPLDGAGRSVLYLSRSSKSSPFQLVVPGALDPQPADSPLPSFTTTPSPTPSPTR
jgi:hypothetical protein